MKWIDAKSLENWSGRLDARASLPVLLGRLIRASAPDITRFRFPGGDSAQIHGWDGRLAAEPQGQYKSYVPSGNSVWEFGVTRDPKAKAEGDYSKRTANPGPEVDPATTTFVFVTPRTWEGGSEWAGEKKKAGAWKDVLVLDGIDLEDWLALCPAVASRFARENGFAPEGVVGIDEFWEIYSRRFQPALTEEVVLAGRSVQRTELEAALAEGTGIRRCKGDSLEEVLAFVCAIIRSADETSKEYLKARTLIVQTEEAARQLEMRENLLFAVRGSARSSAGLLGDRHRVIVPVGRDDMRSGAAIALVRPTAHEMGEALQTMGLDPVEALRLAYESGKSVTILARRIPSSQEVRADWCNDRSLIPALLAGAWDHLSGSDRGVIAGLAGVSRYEDIEGDLRKYLKLADAPLELVGSVWAVRAPVDLFAQIAHLLGDDDWNALRNAAHITLGEKDPALDMPAEERQYASLSGKTLNHSQWLRDGIATTLLILAALGEQNDVSVGNTTPQRFVNELIAALPGIRDDHRVIASLSQQLPMLMEAAPDPLLSALEHLLEGDGEKMRPIFQDGEGGNYLWTRSAHTGLLWALEIIGQDPEYLQRAALILAQLTAVDPGGRLTNRPLGSFRSLFLTWKPSTNASHERRLSVLENVTNLKPEVAWALVSSLLPKYHDVQMEGPRPRFREAGASQREQLTWSVVYSTLSWIIRKSIQLAGTDAKRWMVLLDNLGQMRLEDRELVLKDFRQTVVLIPDAEHPELWKALRALTRRHRAFPNADWVLASDQLVVLEDIASQIAPADLGIDDRYLFTDGLPDIPKLDVGRVSEQIEEVRTEAVRRIVAEAGVEGLVRFAEKVEAPRLVGASFGFIARDPGEILQAILLAESTSPAMRGFTSALSSGALHRFGGVWTSMARDAVLTRGLSPSFLQDLVMWWPHARETWNWVASFGADAEATFWKEKQAWGLQAEGPELAYAIGRYLEVDRAEYLVDAICTRSKEIATPDLVRILEAYEVRIRQNPDLLRGQTVGWHVQQIFSILKKRDDCSLALLAGLEYRYLPLLRELWSDTDRDSALDRFMAENPAFFIQVLCDVFRPIREREKERPDFNEQERARARNGLTLLESFSRIPGLVGNDIDAHVLDTWVAEVRSLAKAADRADIADQYIGKLLSHAPNDPVDGLWPHTAVRAGLESWKSDQVELGIYIGKKNARGVTMRGPMEGGGQERAQAIELRKQACKYERWPRTAKLFLSWAEAYESEAKFHDIEVEKLRLRD